MFIRKNVYRVSQQTRNNWLVDAALLSSALIVSLSSSYFLFLPSNGYQGGRNPWANVQIIFSRQSWDLIHTWSGVLIIGVACIHLVLHWSWVVSMARRTIKELTGKCVCMNARGRFNLILNIVVALSFLLSAVSGVYFLFVPASRWAADPMILFSRTIWDLLHTWAGILFIISAVTHIAIHWKWVTKVTRSIFPSLVPVGKAVGESAVLSN